MKGRVRARGMGQPGGSQPDPSEKLVGRYVEYDSAPGTQLKIDWIQLECEYFNYMREKKEQARRIELN